MSAPAAAAAAAAAPAPSSSPASAADDKSARHPPWLGPHGQSDLRVHNSLTSSKVPFLPSRDRFIGWYTCGPTVYDSAHLGHARCYGQEGGQSIVVTRRLLPSGGMGAA